MEIGAGLQAGAFLQNLAEIFVGRAGIGRGLQDDELSFLQIRADGFAGLQDVRNVGLAILVQRRGDTDDDRVDVFHAGEVCRGGELFGLEGFGDCG